MSEQKDMTAVRETIQSLIENGSTYNLDELERIYHRDLEVVMIDERGSVAVSSKPENMRFFRMKRDSRTPPLSRWAEFNHVEVRGDTGHVVVTRKMALRGEPEKFVLSIRLTREDSRWQVTQETVFVQPLDVSVR